MTKKTSKNFSLYNIFCNFAADFAYLDKGAAIKCRLEKKHYKPNKT